MGEPVDFGPVSASEDAGSALPYAENGDGDPVVFVIEGAPKAINVQGQAEKEGFAEAEWITAGQFRVTGVEHDDDARWVTVTPSKEAPDAVPEADTPDVAGPGSSPDPSPGFPGPAATEAPAGSEGEGLSELPEFARSLVSPGDKVYVHPQGSVVIVTPSGSIAKYGPDLKPRKTSATAAKLAVGHGQWKPVAISKPAPRPVPKDPPVAAKPMTDLKPAEAVVIAKPEPELPSAPAPSTSKFRVPMTFNEVEVSQVPAFVDDPAYHFQQKVDGIRGQLVIEPGKAPWFRSKSGERLVSSSAAKITGPILKALGTSTDYEGPAYVVDGEVLDGKWYIFDVVPEGSEKTPWSDRMTMAEAWVNEMHKVGITNIQALPTARTPEEKRALWESVNASGGEGVMIKRTDAPYNYGARVNHTLKAKITSTADVVVMERNRDGKENAVIGVNVNGKLTEIGTVSMQGKEKTTPVGVGDVIEVKYLWAMPGALSLQQPRYMKRRPDKKADDATPDQFRFVSKEVVDKEDWSSAPVAPDEPPEDEAPPVVEETPAPPPVPDPTPEATKDPVSTALEALAGTTVRIEGDPRSPEGARYIYNASPSEPGKYEDKVSVIRKTDAGWSWVRADGTESPLSDTSRDLWLALLADEGAKPDFGSYPDDSWKWTPRQSADAGAWFEMPTKPHAPYTFPGSRGPSQRESSAYYRASSAWQTELDRRMAAGSPPTVDVRVSDPVTASDAELDGELKRLSAMAAAAHQDEANVQDATTKKSLDAWDHYISGMSRANTKRIMKAAAPIRAESLRRLEAWMAPVIADESEYDAERWKKAESAAIYTDSASGTFDEDKLQKIRDNYVVNDAQTISKNASLRSGSPTPAAKSWRGRVNSWIKSQVAEDDAVVYRGSALPPAFVRQLTPGTTITDPGIVSTDQSESGAVGYLESRLGVRPDGVPVLFEILVPGGHPIVDAMYGEYVLPSDTPMTVRKVSYENGTYRVRVELPAPGTVASGSGATLRIGGGPEDLATLRARVHGVIQ